MNDRELLELAAKAAGYEVNFSEPVNGWFPHGYDDNGDVDKWWNPLLSDGDALRLAVGLRLDICTEENDPHPTLDRQIRHVNVWPFYGTVGASEDLDSPEPCAATRRAIVRAAAEIGKAMP
ncbi:MAG TPA: hypothetical protein VL528_10785 [Oxalicibacterium sp.]|jgi:hypothetical protein|nr:hypothetical protein [Oxalicibacterium sp.]